MQSFLKKPTLLVSVIIIASFFMFPGTTVRAQESVDSGSIVPAQPLAFEPVYLELPRTCSFGWSETYEPHLHQVERTADGFLVRSYKSGTSYNPEGCGPRYLVRLGELAQGTYEVTLFINDSESPEAEYEFTVTDSGVGDINAPAFDYSGFYWDPLESGSSLQVIQTGKESLGAVLLTYDDYGKQQWIVIGAGQWKSPGRYVGKAWKTRNGHPIASPQPDQPTQAEAELIGEASIDFGGGIGTDPNSASVYVNADGELLFQRNYQRFEF